MSRQSSSPRRRSSRSWEPVADWYAGWVGAEGSIHHQATAIPALLDLLAPGRGERVLDLGCGPGVLAPHVAAAGASYVGVDLSPRLVAHARRRRGRHGRFLVGDATRLPAIAGLKRGGFDAAVFLLSIQDIDPLDRVVAGAAWALAPGGRIVVFMLHPCFRVPRQSGWGFDAKRSLQFRRVDRYLTPLDVPMQAYGGGRGATWSYHRPLEAYVAEMADAGLVIDRVREIPVGAVQGRLTRAEKAARQEIPLFLALRAFRR